jgi:hypothetical protein
MLQINRNKRTLTPRGEEQVAILVFCSNCFFSSQVRLGGGGSVVLSRAIPELAL